MPETYTPDAGSPDVQSWAGYPYTDPFAYDTHNNRKIPGYELVQHQQVTLFLRDGFLRYLGSQASKGLAPALSNGLQADPVAKNPPVKLKASTRLMPADSGKTFTNRGLFVLTVCQLPPVEAGLLYRFIDVIGTGSPLIRAVPRGSDNIVYGALSSLVSGGGSGYIETAGKGIFELYCDGTDWQVTYINAAYTGLA